MENFIESGERLHLLKFNMVRVNFVSEVFDIRKSFTTDPGQFLLLKKMSIDP